MLISSSLLRKYSAVGHNREVAACVMSWSCSPASVSVGHSVLNLARLQDFRFMFFIQSNLCLKYKLKKKIKLSP
jgi:hypothetical protein